MSFSGRQYRMHTSYAQYDFRDWLETTINAWSWGGSPKYVVSRRNTPPTSPANNELYLVTATATGDWIGFEKYLALWVAGTSQWAMYAPQSYRIIYSYADAKYYIYEPSPVSDWRETHAQPEALLNEPIAILEHILMLQNWTDQGGTEQPGKEYSSSAQINRDNTEGGFLCSILGPALTSNAFDMRPRDLRPARQLLDIGDCWTDDLAQDICAQFYLCNYQDFSGRESVSYLDLSEDSITEITLGDIIGEIGDMIEPRASEIYVEPVINYAWDQLSGKYKSQLKITNIEKSSYTTGCAAGFMGTDGETIWGKCKLLWNMTRQIEKIPSSISDCKWIQTYNDALWYINKFVTWQGKRRTTFSVSYATGRLWHVGTHFDLSLPHQTDDITVECIVEEIKKSKNKNTVSVSVIILEDIPTAFFFE
jgi:hypothetical protein